jgi:hypothetical protein
MKIYMTITNVITLFKNFKDVFNYFILHLIKIWYNISTSVEDRATLGSDPSANAGGYTEAVHFARPLYIIYNTASGSHKSDKSQGAWGTASPNTIKQLIHYNFHYIKLYINFNYNIFRIVYDDY